VLLIKREKFMLVVIYVHTVCFLITLHSSETVGKMNFH
jgi:hypothetical protein